MFIFEGKVPVVVCYCSVTSVGLFGLSNMWHLLEVRHGKLT